MWYNTKNNILIKPYRTILRTSIIVKVNLLLLRLIEYPLIFIKHKNINRNTPCILLSHYRTIQKEIRLEVCYRVCESHTIAKYKQKYALKTVIASMKVTLP